MARVEETSTEPQDLDPLGLGWRLVLRKETEFDDPRWAIVFPDGETLNLNHGSWGGQQEVGRLWHCALELKAAEIRQSQRAGALEAELDIVRAARTAKKLKFTLKDLDADVARIAPAIQRALEDHLGIPAVEQDAKKDEGERLLKLAPEVPSIVPADPLSSEVVRAHDRCDDLYRGMRVFDARFDNLEEVTATLERRLDFLGEAYDRHFHAGGGYGVQARDRTPVLLPDCQCKEAKGVNLKGQFRDYRSPIGTRCPLHGERHREYYDDLALIRDKPQGQIAVSAG